MGVYAYQSTILQGTGKNGVIKCDADGYYEVIAGGFDTYNSANAFYTWASAKQFYDQASVFMRRIKSGALYGEDGHPVYDPKYNSQQWLTRIHTIDHNLRSHHIRELSVDDTVFKNRDGQPMITIFMRVKPSGPRADSVASSLENKHENTAFSIRSITDDYICPRTGIRVKNMKTPITYDYVIEPGIDKATKYNSPSLENRDLGEEFTFTEKDVKTAIDYVRKIPGSFEAESIVASLEHLLEREIVRPATGIVTADPFKPLSSQW